MLHSRSSQRLPLDVRLAEVTAQRPRAIRAVTLLRLATVLLAAAPVCAQAPEPKFVAGDLAALDSRVVAARQIDGVMQLLTVEVGNKGTVAAEPLQFRIELPAKKSEPPQVATFARALLPHAARFGRPVPAAGKATYFVPTALPGKKGQFTVQVTAASFVDGGSVPKPAVVVGQPDQVQRTSLAGTFPVTKVAMTNPVDATLDVLMLVTFEQPKDRVDLVGVRLDARATRDVVFATLPGVAAYLDPTMELPGCAMKATAFEIVDWCLVGAVPVDAGANVLRDAYEAWYRWPEADTAVAGDFVFRERQARFGQPGTFDDFLIKGRFAVTAAGETNVEVLEGTGANASYLLRELVSNLRRPDFAALAANNRLQLVADDRVALIGPGWSMLTQDSGQHRTGGAVKAEESADLQVRDGRIVSDGRGSGERTAWEWQSVDGREVVTRRAASFLETRYSYATLGGRLVPLGASQENRPGNALFTASEIQLSNLRFDGVAPAPRQEPAGAGALALRELWNAGYRLPTEPLVIETKFTLTTGNDGVWRGKKKLSGTLVMEGIGRNLRSSDCAFDGTLAREDEVQFAAMLRDRLLMWYGRDFNDRQPFDELFAGATVEAPDAEGVFRVTDCWLDRVFTSGGLVRGLRAKGGGTTTKFTWEKIGDRQVVGRIDEKIGGPDTPAARRWDAATIVTLAPVGEHLLPAKIVFERIFGRDWATETLVFRDTKLRAK